MTRRHFSKVSLSSAAGMLIPDRIFPRSEEDSSFQKVKRIPKTDTHVHLFGLDHLDYPWLKNAPEIDKTFLPEDFIEASQKSNVGKILFMESGAASGSSLKEVRWVIEQSKKDSRIKGIIAKGQITREGLIDPPVEELLATGWVKGIRGSTSQDVLASSSFVKSMKMLADNDLSFDLLIQPTLFSEVAKAIKKTPNTTFILDHLGNPDIKGHDFEYWKKGIDDLARLPNINCKISGLITKAGKYWTVQMLKPYVHYVIERFGFERIVYGGDWPVVLRAGSYHSWSRAFEKLTRSFSKTELHRLYHLNADRIYQLADE